MHDVCSYSDIFDFLPMTGERLRLTVIVVSCFLFVAQVVTLWFGVPAAFRGRADFRYLYTMGSTVRANQLPHLDDYETNRRSKNESVNRNDQPIVLNSSVYEALLFAPFSFLTYRAAYIAFVIANGALLAVSILILRPYLDKLGTIWPYLPAAVFVCFFPVAQALIEGQDSILLLTLMVASAVSFYRGRDVYAGVFLGLALFKFQFTIPIALLFLLWRRWRIVSGFAATTAAIASISLLLAGVTGLRASLYQLIRWNSPLTTGEISDRVPALPTLRCLFHTLAGSIISRGWVDGVAIGCSILLIAWAATRTANFALAVLVALLVSSHGVFADAALLVIPVAMVLDARLGVSTDASRLWSRNIASLLFVAPLICFLSGLSYCFVAILMLGLLMPLRFTSSDSVPRYPDIKENLLMSGLT